MPMKFYLFKHEIIPQKRWFNVFLIVTGFIIVVYLFLIMPDLTRPKELEPFRNCLFAHRGLFDNRCYVPENSLIAFQNAIDHGYGIELDVQLTKDKVPVVAHDYTLKRVCGKDVKIADLTLKELRDYKLFYSNEGIPTLKETLDLVDGQIPLMIELKVGLNYKETCRRVAAELENYHGHYCIISFSPLVLQWFREKMPDVIRGQLSTNFFKDHIDGTPVIKFMLSHLLLNFLSRPDFISYSCKYDSDPSLQLCKNLFGAPIAMWTIRNEEQYNEVIQNYDMIVFDGFLPPSYDEPLS